MNQNIRIPVCVWIKTKRKRERERAFLDVVFLTLPYENKKQSYLIIFRIARRL
jgi:uncharacterized protein YlbG (UPF0298 family)